MRKLFLIIEGTLLSLFLIFLFVKNLFVQVEEEYAPNEVVVKFKEGENKYSIQDIISSVQGTIVTYQGKKISPFNLDPDILSLRSFHFDPYCFHIKVPETIGTERAISILSKIPIIEYAEKNLVHYPLEHYSCPSIWVNDEFFGGQWGLLNTGQSGGTSYSDISATYAWRITTGSSDVVVAVIDSGVDYNHKDLAANIWINTPEDINGDGKFTAADINGVDEDGNELVDDVIGWDWRQDGEGNWDNDPMDAEHHGTHIAGIIGAVGNNGIGITGINWNAKIMILKVAWFNPVTSKLSGYYGTDLKHALEYAMDKGVHISNNSYGGCPDNYLYAAIQEAQNQGHLFITAAGNDAKDIDISHTYPACWDFDNIITVTSSNDRDFLSCFSNWGATSVDLAAPGGEGYSPDNHGMDDIFSTRPSDNYQFGNGTSYAAPLVAGTAALILSLRPDLSWQQVKQAIMTSVDPKSTHSGKTVTGGRLNAYKALLVFPPVPETPSSLSAFPTAYSQINLSWQDNSYVEEGYKIERGTSPAQFSVIGTKETPCGMSAVSYEDKTCLVGTTYYFRVKAYNPTGGSSYSNTVSATIPTGPPNEPSFLEGEFLWSSHKVKLTWSDSSNNEQGFRIERKSEYESSWKQISSVGQNVNIYYDTNVSRDTFYYYRVRAYNPYGYSPYSEEVQVYVPWY